MTLLTFAPTEREKHSGISSALPPTFRPMVRFAEWARRVSLCLGVSPCGTVAIDLAAAIAPRGRLGKDSQVPGKKVESCVESPPFFPKTPTSCGRGFCG